MFNESSISCNVLPNSIQKIKSLHNNWRFPLRISSVNMNVNVNGHIYWRNPWWETSFFVHCNEFSNKDLRKKSSKEKNLQNVAGN